MTDRPALFLERRSYRRRRLTDMIRALPVVGALLWAVPLLWPLEGEGTVRTSDAIIYIFSVWAGLIVVSALLTRLMPRGEGRTDDGQDGA
ncbi:hypothetical protein SAMN04490248_10255 [Salinihabitans flavidus]|uniref:Uncharacterized protein n=1 Tax=Salinihabitans flavidus TaxID=569882 RepID=A0A1H8MF89_9RHOB|nr:hypothetical protein [Salinihabitans flavidus]SEO15940.1 hypothetical protein SAMN04490248_10255 [Salinihabitans flavidus]